MSGQQLTNADAAALVGITAASWRRYVSSGRAPRPDGHLGRTPWWRPDTIEQWKAQRPGQGKGGGRPRNNPTAGVSATSPDTTNRPAPRVKGGGAVRTYEPEQAAKGRKA